MQGIKLRQGVEAADLYAQRCGWENAKQMYQELQVTEEAEKLNQCYWINESEKDTLEEEIPKNRLCGMQNEVLVVAIVNNRVYMIATYVTLLGGDAWLDADKYEEVFC